MRCILNRLFRLSLLGSILAGVLCSSVNAGIVVHYRAQEHEGDARFVYDLQLLKLALEQDPTLPKVTLKPVPSINNARTVAMIGNNSIPGFVASLGYKKEYSQHNLIAIPFPVNLGIHGYRVCFMSSSLERELGSVESLDQLLDYVHGQGKGWRDVEVLRYNGFNVLEMSNFESLFKMVAKNRIDFFCRGASELYREYRAHRHIEDLSYDKSFVLYYPFPRFFYTHASNKDLAERILNGLKVAHGKGLVQELGLKYYQPSVDFVELHKRRVFELDNPHMLDFPYDVDQYLYRPLQENVATEDAEPLINQPR